MAERLRERPFRIDRLKTGTPARLDSKTLDYSKMDEQPGDQPLPVFSALGSVDLHPRQVSCHITYTSEETHDIIRSGLDRSPLFTGSIEGTGPRYCPSIEDKVVRFADKTSHQIFVEPEGLNSTEVYPNGISTSLPYDIQERLIHSIPGFEQAHIIRPGYAIEYDYFDPRDLRPDLTTRFFDGLYFAGQINGTTGYEEAAAQGLVAGANAAASVLGREPLNLQRSQAYIGVLIDDLITRGTSEPYRMFTSRAEYRLMLREDNADLRLTEIGHQMGLVDELRWRTFNEHRDALEQLNQALHETWLRPGDAAEPDISAQLPNPISREYRAAELLKRPELGIDDLAPLLEAHGEFEPRVYEQAEINAKYAGYLSRQQDEIEKAQKHETTELPENLDYALVKGLSNEVRQKLSDVRPATIGQAARISGVTPAAISLLLVHLKRLPLLTQKSA